MSERFANRSEVRNKVEWESGVIGAVDYGLKSTDMPEGDTELIDAWDKLVAGWNELKPLLDAVEKLLDEPDSAREAIDAQTLHDSPGADL